MFKQNDYVEMNTGRKLYLHKPVFVPEEIAHSLSLSCRFTGHCKKFYSVAEHSMLVADIMRYFNLGDPFEGLLHDGTESVLADISSPVKALLPDYKMLEHHFDTTLRKQFGLPEEMTAGCKKADWIALAIEAAVLMPTRGKKWNIPRGIRPQAHRYFHECLPHLAVMTSESIRRMWLLRFQQRG